MVMVPVVRNNRRSEISNRGIGLRDLGPEIFNLRMVGSGRTRKVLISYNIQFLGVVRTKGTMGKASRDVIRGREIFRPIFRLWVHRP